jgi:hypothetical protein
LGRRAAHLIRAGKRARRGVARGDLRSGGVTPRRCSRARRRRRSSSR